MYKQITLISLITTSALLVSGCTATTPDLNSDAPASVEASDTTSGSSGNKDESTGGIEETPFEPVVPDSEEDLQEKNPEGGVSNTTTPGIGSPMEFPIMVSLFSSSCNAAKSSGLAMYSEDSGVISLIAAEQDKFGETVGFTTSSNGDVAVTENLNDFDVCLVSNVIDLIIDPEYTDLGIEITSFEIDQMELRVAGIALPTLSDRLSDREHLDIKIRFDLDTQSITTISSKPDKDSNYSPIIDFYYGEGTKYDEALALYNSVAG